MSAVIYVRISRDSEGLGLGVQRQEQACRALALREGFPDPMVLVENDTSAYKGDRPVYQHLLGRIRAGEVKAVFVWHVDRLHRQTVELEEYINAAGGVPTYSVEGSRIDLSTPDGRAVAKTLGAWAQYESEHKAARNKAKHAQLRASGQMVGARSFGWQTDAQGRLTGTLHPTEAGVLRECAERILSGESPYRLAQELNERGVTTTKGGRWTHANLRLTLQNPKIAGLRAHKKQVVTDELGNPVVGQWEPILTVPEWERLCAVLNLKKHMRAGSTKHLLGGLVRCECGEVMYGQSRSKQENVLACQCGCTIAESKVRKPVIDAVASAVMFGDAGDQQDTTEAHKGLSGRLSDLEQQKARLVEAVAEAVLSLKDVAAKKQSIESEIAEVSQALDAALLAGSAGDVFASIRAELWKGKTVAFSDAVEAKAQIRAEFENLSFEKKRALIKACVKTTVRKGRGADRVETCHVAARSD